jgi:hypothetical protein
MSCEEKHLFSTQFRIRGEPISSSTLFHILCLFSLRFWSELALFESDEIWYDWGCRA